MKITVRYTAQLAQAAGTKEETIESEDSLDLMNLLQEKCSEHGSEFAKFVVDDAGKPVSTLVVALNGTQVSLDSPIEINRDVEILLVTPMSGG